MTATVTTRRPRSGGDNATAPGHAAYVRLTKTTAIAILVLGLGLFFLWAVARKFRSPPMHPWEEQRPDPASFGRPKR